MPTLRRIWDERTPLCQQGLLSCAACCGVYNFGERSAASISKRLLHRTQRVAQAAWDPVELARAAAELTQEEAPHLLFQAVKTCPLAGFLDAQHTRVGCLIHPARHPQGEDLRDLGAYGDRSVCENHLCAPHQWLSPAEKTLLCCAKNHHIYSMGIGECGFLKSALTWVANHRGAAVAPHHLHPPQAQAAGAALLDLWEAWPFVDPNPRRFGGYSFEGEDAYTRTAPSAGRFNHQVTRLEAIMLDALGTHAPDESTSMRAVDALRLRLRALSAAMPL